MNISRIKFSLVAVAGLCFLISSAHAQSNRPTITVQGVCLKSVTPDRGSVTLTARVKDKDAGGAMQKASDIYARLLERTRALKLKDAEYATTNYSVNEEIDWSNNKRISLGFNARMGLDVSTSETKRLGEIIKIGSDLRLEEAGNLNLFVSEAKMKEAYESCLEEATRNARSKAESIAKGANTKVGKLVSINEEGTTSPRPPSVPMAKMARAEMAEMAAPEISARDTKITVQVEATFSID